MSIVSETHVAYASPLADKTCSDQTRLMYYMEPGELLCRPFTANDTHSPKEDLLVKHTDVEFAGAEYARRSMGTAAILGFHGLSCTYGSDMIILAETNAQLRQILRAELNESETTINLESYSQNGSFDTSALNAFLDTMSWKHSAYASIYTPEVCFVSRIV